MHIYRADGIRGFYRGLYAAVCHNAPQSALYFGLYSTFKTLTGFLIDARHTG